jgi:hypothetical protein
MHASLLMRWRVWCLPKRDHSAEEYEDAFAANPEHGRFAIADGASESSFARLWAQLLVEEFVQAPPGHPLPWAEWLSPLRKRWAEAVDGRSLPWYAEMKAQQGGFATFLGLVLEADRWRAVSVGDCCLFQLRREEVLRAFPLTRAADFGNVPRLVGSRAGGSEPAVTQQAVAEGAWQVNDWLLLMTDALAQWFLSSLEAARESAWSLRSLLEDNANSAAFASWVEGLRDREGLRNDDVTLLAVSFRRRRTVE